MSYYFAERLTIALVCGLLGLLLLAGCGESIPSTPSNSAPSISNIEPIISTINVAIDMQMSDYVSDADGDDVTCSVSAPNIAGLSISNESCTGTPTESGVYEIIIQATDSHGASRSGSIILVIEAAMADLPIPFLASTHDDHEALIDNIPAHFTNDVTGFDNVEDSDNTPADNRIDNATATLGRVLFYDKRLSANNTLSCASCHQQAHGFADPRALSLGFKGEETGRHAQALTNNRYYERGHYFWDERADTLEDQVLLPIQSDVEMGMELDELEDKLALTSYYADLFDDAFGDSTITSERIALALAQFVRSMISYNSSFDNIFDSSGTPNYAALSASERRGLQLFSGNAGLGGRNLRCDACHTTVSQVSDTVHNIGLDLSDSDAGAGDGRFKAPSLRNVALRQTFMHDGRFSSLEQVIRHYSTGIQDNPNLSNRLERRGRPIRFNLNQTEINDLIAFLESLTDSDTQSNTLHSDPFDLATINAFN